MEFKVGDVVYVEDSAQDDCTLDAWNYIVNHRKGTIVNIIANKTNTGTHVQCAVEFEAEFPGGHYCSASVDTRRGQYVMAQNLSLCFEESREVVTVPQPSEFLTDNTKWYEHVQITGP